MKIKTFSESLSEFLETCCTDKDFNCDTGEVEGLCPCDENGVFGYGDCVFGFSKTNNKCTNVTSEMWQKQLEKLN